VSRIPITVELDIEDVVEQLADQLDYDGIIELVKELDHKCQDWDVTERLYAHFAELHAEYLKEKEYDARVAAERAANGKDIP
jgi:hypothetical protein